MFKNGKNRTDARKVYAELDLKARRDARKNYVEDERNLSYTKKLGRPVELTGTRADNPQVSTLHWIR